MRLIGFVFLLLLFSCEKDLPECWICKTMNQVDDSVVKQTVFCDKDWTEIITIADSLNTYGVTYTSCKKEPS
jgi:hypothetical protein